MINGINHITLAVSEIIRSFDFYYHVLGFKPLCKWENSAYFLVGNDWFCLNVDSTVRKNKNIDCTHYAFSLMKNDFLAISDRIIKSGAEIYKENFSEGDSLYFLDPDGHKLEIHVGNWQSRVKEKKINLGSWHNITWYV